MSDPMETPVTPTPEPLTDSQIAASVSLYTMQWRLAQPKKGRRQGNQAFRDAAAAHHALQMLATIAALKARSEA